MIKHLTKTGIIRPLLGILLLVQLCIKSEAQEYKRLATPIDTNATELLRKATEIQFTQPDSSMMLSRKALVISQSCGNNRSIAQSLLHIGLLHLDKKAFEQSKSAFYRAFYYSLSQNDLAARLYNNLGSVALLEGYRDSALHFYLLSLAEIKLKDIVDSTLIMHVYINLGSVFAYDKQSSQALYYLRKGFLMARQQKNKSSMAQVYLGLAVSYNRYDENSAISYYQKSLHLFQQLKRTKKIAEVYIHLGACEGRLGNLSAAKKYFDSAIAVDPKGASENAELLRHMGDVYYTRGMYTKANQYYLQSIAISEQKAMNFSKIRTYARLAESYSKTGNFRQAYRYLRKNALLRDTLEDTEKTKAVNQLEIKFRVSEKEKEIAEGLALQYRQKVQLQQKNTWIIISIGLGLLALAVATGIYRTHKQKQRAQRERIYNLEQQQEVERLKTQDIERGRIARDLHDGLGVLVAASIMNYTVLGKKNFLRPEADSTYREGLQLLEEMRKELRNIAYNLVPELLAEKSLPEALHTLVQRLQNNDAVLIEVQDYGTIVMLEPQLSFTVYRMIEELLHNAIKHSAASQILLQLIFHEEGLNIIAEDNGRGFDTRTAKPGMGLHNLKSRAENNGIILSIRSTKGKGTTIELEVPVKNYNADHKKQYEQPEI